MQLFTSLPNKNSSVGFLSLIFPTDFWTRAHSRFLAAFLARESILGDKICCWTTLRADPGPLNGSEGSRSSWPFLKIDLRGVAGFYFFFKILLAGILSSPAVRGGMIAKPGDAFEDCSSSRIYWSVSFPRFAAIGVALGEDMREDTLLWGDLYALFAAGAAPCGRPGLFPEFLPTYTGFYLAAGYSGATFRAFGFLAAVVQGGFFLYSGAFDF